MLGASTIDESEGDGSTVASHNPSSMTQRHQSPRERPLNSLSGLRRAGRGRAAPSLHLKLHRVGGCVPGYREVEVVRTRTQARCLEIEDIAPGRAERCVEPEVVIRVGIAG